MMKTVFALGMVAVLALSACALSPTPLPPSPTVTTTSTLQPSLTRTAAQSTRTTQPTHTARPPTLTLPPTATLINGSTSKIAFASCDTRFASCEIFVINADGSQVFRMTNNNIDECCPDWSPDGSKLAFVQGSGREGEIWVMAADGSHPANLTNNNAEDCCLAWSPDGSKIAFVQGSDREGEIWVMAADGSHPANLTNNNAEDCCLAWSPDGSKIAFVSNTGIYVMNADGSNPIRLARTNHYFSPAWSPDGTRIAFLVSDFSVFPSVSAVNVINADGSNLIQMTTTGDIPIGQYAWSPDGTKIAYTSCKLNFDSCEIYVVDADGSNPTNLTNSEASDRFPVWSPDGAKIAFESGRDQDWKINVMNADGSNPIRLIEHRDADFPIWSPIWSPDGTKIAFKDLVKGYIYVMNADGSGLMDSVIIAHIKSFSWQPILATPSTFGPDCTLGGTRLTTGILAQVSETIPASIRVRSGPRRINEEIAQLLPGTVVEVLEGPVCADGLVFWKVESDLIPGGVGWTTEDYLVPYNP